MLSPPATIYSTMYANLTYFGLMNQQSICFSMFVIDFGVKRAKKMVAHSCVSKDIARAKKHLCAFSQFASVSVFLCCTQYTEVCVSCKIVSMNITVRSHSESCLFRKTRRFSSPLLELPSSLNEIFFLTLPRSQTLSY